MERAGQDTCRGIAYLPRLKSALRSNGMDDVVHFDMYEFGSITIDGVTHTHDVVIDRGGVHKRKKKPSKRFRGSYGHTPLSTAEEIPWNCRRLVVGTGAHGGLPIMDDVRREAQLRHVELVIATTAKAIDELNRETRDTNAILHVTC
jgi:hypothetical protein